VDAQPSDGYAGHLTGTLGPIGSIGRRIFNQDDLNLGHRRGSGQVQLARCVGAHAALLNHEFFAHQ
jgi:hypothetical protein